MWSEIPHRRILSAFRRLEACGVETAYVRFVQREFHAFVRFEISLLARRRYLIIPAARSTDVVTIYPPVDTG